MKAQNVAVFFYGLFMDRSLLALADKLGLPDEYLQQIRDQAG